MPTAKGDAKADAKANAPVCNIMTLLLKSEAGKRIPGIRGGRAIRAVDGWVLRAASGGVYGIYGGSHENYFFPWSSVYAAVMVPADPAN